MSNGPSNTSIPHSRPQPMTPNRSYCRPTHNFRPRNLIPLPYSLLTSFRTNSINFNRNSMMTRCSPRRDLPRAPHTPCPKRPSIRHDLIYCFRSTIFLRILLSLLSLKFSPHPRTRRMLAPHRNCTPRPFWSAPTQHSCSISIRGHSYMSPPQYHRRQTKTSHSISYPYNYSWRLFHSPTSIRILRSPLHNCRRRLWCNFLCSHRVPRPSCTYRLFFLSCLPSTTNSAPLHHKPPLRIWSRCMILTFCRCSMTISLCLYLLMRRLIFLVLSSIGGFQPQGLG